MRSLIRDASLCARNTSTQEWCDRRRCWRWWRRWHHDRGSCGRSRDQLGRRGVSWRCRSPHLGRRSLHLVHAAAPRPPLSALAAFVARAAPRRPLLLPTLAAALPEILTCKCKHKRAVDVQQARGVSDSYINYIRSSGVPVEALHEEASSCLSFECVHLTLRLTEFVLRATHNFC